jgi:hypothetical protein
MLLVKNNMEYIKGVKRQLSSKFYMKDLVGQVALETVL